MNYDLSILDKLMFPNPLIMLVAKVSSHEITTTKARLAWVGWLCQTGKDVPQGLHRVSVFSFVPSSRVGFLDMFRMVFKKLEVLYSIIGFYVVDVMNSFLRFKLAAKVLFHNVPMLQNPSSIYIDAHITQGANAGLPLLEIRPVRGDTVIAVTMIPAAMHLAYTSSSFIEHSVAFLDVTYFSKSHKNIITQGVN